MATFPSSSTSPPPPSPRLHILASSCNWERLAEETPQRPQDCLWKDDRGRSVLHVLCSSSYGDDSTAILKLVRPIIAIHPETIAWGDHTSWNPLHLACFRSVPSPAHEDSNDTLILELIRACPAALLGESSTMKQTPFHVCCGDPETSPKILSAMLQYHPSLATRRDAVGTPLELLWKAKGQLAPQAFSIQCDILLRAATSGIIPDWDDRNPSISISTSAATKADAVPQDTRQQTPFHRLSAACSIPCPNRVLNLLIEWYPEQVSKPDTNGKLPIHCLLENTADRHKQSIAYILERLLQVAPETASVPFPCPQEATAILPLQEAVRLQLGWHRPVPGIQALVEAYPAALLQPDPRTGLVPALASAEVAILGNSLLSTTFELLRGAPQVVDPAYWASKA